MLPRIIRENRYAVLDLETTGVDRNRDEIIQMAIVQVDYGQPRIRATSYVRPLRRIHDEAIAKHGITWDILEHAAAFREVWPEFERLIGDRCLMGYNIKTFDHPVLTRQIAEIGGRANLCALDVLPWQRRFAKEAGSTGRHNLAIAAERWGVPQLPHHDALNDCRMTWNVFVRLAVAHPALGEAELNDVLAIKAVAELPADLAL